MLCFASLTRSGEQMSVREETGLAHHTVLAGDVPDDDQGSPGELIRVYILSYLGGGERGLSTRT